MGVRSLVQLFFWCISTTKDVQALSLEGLTESKQIQILLLTKHPNPTSHPSCLKSEICVSKKTVFVILQHAGLDLVTISHE